MISVRTIADITPDRQVVVTLPPETPLGKAELVVTISPQPIDAAQRGGLKRWFGAAHSGNSRSADSERIDVDLSRAYGESFE
jgi:hypothetical protein